MLTGIHKELEEKYLGDEIGKAELGRIRFLLIFFGFLAAVVALLRYFFHDFFLKNLGDTFKYDEVRIVFFWIAVYYLIAFMTIFYLRNKQNKNLTKVARIMNAIIEGCLPSMMLYYTALPGDLAFSLSNPSNLAYGIFIVLSTLRLDYRLSLITTGVAVVSFYVVNNLLIKQSMHNHFESIIFQSPIIIAKTILIFLTGVCATYVAINVKKKVSNAFRYIQEREEVKNLLGSHVSPQVAHELINNKKIDKGEERDLSIMFLDIRNFTTFAETKDPQEVFLFLNEFFAPMIEIINERGGVINKFLGDGFMAIFGAPIHNKDHAKKAVESAKCINKYVQEYSKDKSLQKNIDIGIGIHSGKAMTGNVGSNLRKEYTVIGDVVNLASRIEQLNKQLKSEILISEETKKCCGDFSFQTENLGGFEVKGRHEKATILKLA